MDDLQRVPIRLERCAKTFPGGTRALEPLDLSIEAGETIVLLGPSGCGKTTTLRIIAGLESPDPGGRVLFGEQDVTAIPIERRNVGMVFQSYALFPNLDVAGNVGYGLKVRRIPAAERARRVDEMLAMMRLEPYRERRIGELSGGQRQRVALGRALAVRPRVLLLDEPLTALDAKLREGLRLEIDGLLRSLGITAVYVTHDQSEAMALGDRIVVMSHGRVAQIGRPRDIYYEPRSAFVADFIGTMSRLEGDRVGGRVRLPGGEIAHPGRDGAAVLGFRPEDAQILEQEHGTDFLRGTLRSVFFLGDRTRLAIEGVSRQQVVVETTVRREFRRGDPIRIRIPPDRLLPLEGEQP